MLKSGANFTTGAEQWISCVDSQARPGRAVNHASYHCGQINVTIKSHKIYIISSQGETIPAESLQKQGSTTLADLAHHDSMFLDGSLQGTSQVENKCSLKKKSQPPYPRRLERGASHVICVYRLRRSEIQDLAAVSDSHQSAPLVAPHVPAYSFRVRGGGVGKMAWDKTWPVKRAACVQCAFSFLKHFCGLVP